MTPGRGAHSQERCRKCGEVLADHVAFLDEPKDLSGYEEADFPGVPWTGLYCPKGAHL